MKYIDKYLFPLLGVLFPLLGVLIIFIAMYKDFMGTGNPGLGAPQVVLILIGIIMIIIGYRLKNGTLTFLKKVLTENGKTIGYILAISGVLFLSADLLLGKFYPKVYAPTKYGWSVPENKDFKHKIQDTKGNYRDVVNRYFDHGFKRWPKGLREKPRVLVIGDSFTQMAYVSNGEEWYAYLERAFPDIEFYVFGGGGYGTLQEYMIMDDHFRGIKPDAVIWQFCRNDYHNNYYELDLRRYPHNNHFVRPYWENNNIVYRLPLPYPQLREYSFSADRLLQLYDKKRSRDATKDLSEYLKHRDNKLNNLSLQDKNALEFYKSKAVDVTKALVKKVRALSGDIPIYFINACGEFTEQDRSICDAGNFRCVDFIGEHIKKIEDSGVQVRVENDHHWNYSGNKYAGEKLTDYFNNIGGIISNNR